MNIEKDVVLKPYTTLKIGGPVDYFVCVESKTELLEAVQWAKDASVPVYILGGGSNVLIPDEGIRGLVIKNEIQDISYEEADNVVLVTVGAGVVFDALIQETIAKGYWGLENLSHIPGSTGATVIQNVGAYGVEIKDLVSSVEVFDIKTLTFSTLTTEECTFAYRDSFFKGEEGRDYIIVRVTMCLKREPHPILSYKDLQQRFKSGETPSLKDIRKAVVTIRRNKFPDWEVTGTAGSFFKNPLISQTQYDVLKEQYPELPGFKESVGVIKIPLGWILDKVCNIRGYRDGAVGTFKNQALVLINHGNATAKDVERFASYIENIVRERTNINIEWEVTKIK